MDEATGTMAEVEQDWWDRRSQPALPPGYPEMMDALRTLQDRVAAAVPEPGLIASITRKVEDLCRTLEGCAAPDEWSAISGRFDEIPGRGQLLVPVVRVDTLDDQELHGTVHFGRFYLGANGAAHGGAMPLVFDDILGKLANTGGRGLSRTAYLHVDYRSVTPVGADLVIDAWFEREEGRKRFLRGTLRDGERVCAEATGLFVELRPGQP
jgi:acyl-coenzyme A thioesterase PaaI-like protein